MRWEDIIHEAACEPEPDNESYDTLILDFSASKTVKNKLFIDYPA
jgi:hypothetical protein